MLIMYIMPIKKKIMKKYYQVKLSSSCRDLGAASRHYAIFSVAPALDLNSKPKIPCHLKIISTIQGCHLKVVTHNICYNNSLCGRRPIGQGKGKDERVKSEKIGCRRIAVDPSTSHAHFDFPPFLRPATQQQQQILMKIENITNYITFPPQIAYKLIKARRSEDMYS